MNDADIILTLRDAMDAIHRLSESHEGLLKKIHDISGKALRETDLEETKRILYSRGGNDAGRAPQPG